MSEIIYSSKFKRDYRLMKKRDYDMSLLKEVIRMLKPGISLDEKYKDHPLDGDFIGNRECHLRPDWLLIYWKGKIISNYREQERTAICFERVL